MIDVGGDDGDDDAGEAGDVVDVAVDDTREMRIRRRVQRFG